MEVETLSEPEAKKLIVFVEGWNEPVTQLHLEHPSSSFKFGDIIRFCRTGDWQDREEIGKYIVLGWKEPSSTQFEFCGVKRGELSLECLPIAGDVANSAIENLISEEGDWLGHEKSSILGTQGRVRKCGRVSDHIPGFEASEYFFESLEKAIKGVEGLRYLNMEGTPSHQRVFDKIMQSETEVRTYKDIFQFVCGKLHMGIFCRDLLIGMVETGDKSDVMRSIISFSPDEAKIEKAIDYTMDMISLGKLATTLARFKIEDPDEDSEKKENILDSLEVLKILLELGEKKLFDVLIANMESRMEGVYSRKEHYKEWAHWLGYTALYDHLDIKEFIKKIRSLGILPLDKTNFGEFSKEEIYQNPELYHNRPQFPEIPLSVDNEHSLILEGATGCAKATNGEPCSFCTNSLKNRHFKPVDLGTFVERWYKIRNEMNGLELSSVNKIFYSGADFLSIPQETAIAMLKISKNVHRRITKQEGFANVPTILRKTQEELSELHKAGLNMLYIGGESGDDAILKMMEKGQTKEEIIKAVEKLKSVGIDASLFIMPGLGGFKRTFENASETADLIKKAQPRYVNVLPLTDPPQECIDVINSDLNNRLMTDKELITEMEHIVCALKKVEKNEWKNPVRVESYDPEIAGKVAKTPIVFKYTFMPEPTREQIMHGYKDPEDLPITSCSCG